MNITHEQDKYMFIALTDNGKHIGRILYRPEGNALIATHTRVNAEFQGQGVGEKLLDALVVYAKRQGKTITPLCSFVQAAFQKHPEKYASIATDDRSPQLEATVS